MCWGSAFTKSPTFMLTPFLAVRFPTHAFHVELRSHFLDELPFPLVSILLTANDLEDLESEGTRAVLTDCVTKQGVMIVHGSVMNVGFPPKQR